MMWQSFGDADPRRSGSTARSSFRRTSSPRACPDQRRAGSSTTPSRHSVQLRRCRDLLAGGAAARFPLIKTAVPGWDNDARRQGGGLVLHGSAPQKYQAWLAALVERAQRIRSSASRSSASTPGTNGAKAPTSSRTFISAAPI